MITHGEVEYPAFSPPKPSFRDPPLYVRGSKPGVSKKEGDDMGNTSIDILSGLCVGLGLPQVISAVFHDKRQVYPLFNLISDALHQHHDEQYGTLSEQ
jgi:hypothetical protein